MKRTGSATAAAAIALHGFRMEVLAGQRGCLPTGSLKVGTIQTWSKTYTVSSVVNANNQKNIVNGVFQGQIYDGALALAPNQGFACPGGVMDLKEPGCDGQTVALVPEIKKVFGPTWSDVSGPDAQGFYYITAFIVMQFKDKKGKPCP